MSTGPGITAGERIAEPRLSTNVSTDPPVTIDPPVTKESS